MRIQCFKHLLSSILDLMHTKGLLLEWLGFN